MTAGHLRPLTAREVIAVLTKLGFRERRQTGSHLIFKYDLTGKIVPVPFHGNRELKTGTLRSIIRQSGISPEEFFDLLDR